MGFKIIHKWLFINKSSDDLRVLGDFIFELNLIDKNEYHEILDFTEDVDNNWKALIKENEDYLATVKKPNKKKKK